ncbi:MAG: cytochrome-c oxidase, cbb3-type subunit II [Cupriavidus sp.]|jgi:cytochrome c oxidase cbb3-type subunit 2|uniref:cytochrome-c oxidase, cbb3-type subunit II n=1 Tax=Cupriavidus pauculus TaxID=82633 RepID=UPI000784D2CC|nr:cytochrome-c oxidase, cbb3-type subunit II [Cupriavidus pauculus]MBU68488.1 cytochrome-c oxidase, cbb3-type subunit II [Cupriavidus sp.]KAB0600015.1 cytochrome-c oxidase, cbb3-type subunit II [Cupriavidus pauculus]MBY4730551.1 cytochrome-c oxidase, cbb3-type subunit II [Cupriavidus pauculus]MCM3607943.1 cytochrome-c oxidase, cbb3-type subunit II [Cupriavidus pauculus]UAK99832.1 cytochrome-c oxidase, cbb3-type subunit II [Cupriavidus pauculus]
MAQNQGFFRHETLEKNVGWLIIATIIVVSIAGLVQIVPLFFQHSTTQPDPGITPYSPLRLMGRDIYIREGCVGCHSQQVRTLQAETERYGHFSTAGESVYDHPFLWGSKRTGPDLARVGGRYSDDWQRIHLRNPRDVVPESVMPSYPWLEKTPLPTNSIQDRMRALQRLGVPYSDADIAKAPEQLSGKTEEDAMVAYLQELGLNRRNVRLESTASAAPPSPSEAAGPAASSKE